jgi:CheY-like chemotaxis protein
MKSVLVIDDKDEVRSIIVATLTRAGYAVRQAANGRDGILLSLAQKPDLILCDVRMPEMDGYRMLAAIRGCRSTAAVPFILMTGSVAREEFRRAMVCGADDYLMKPFSRRDLLRVVESRLTRQTEMQSETCHEIDEIPGHVIPPFSPESTPARASMAAAA